MKPAADAAAEPTFVVRFHGVRGSHPVPRPGAASIGGNTSCVEVRCGGRQVIFDLGTGVIPLGDEIARRGEAADALVLVSHLHHDHTMGFPFFKPVYDPRSRLQLVGPSNGTEGFQELLESTFRNPYFPVEPSDMASMRSYRTVGHGELLSWSDAADELRSTSDEPGPDELAIRVFRNTNHPNGGVLCFRLELGGKSLVMATDVEGTEGEEGDLIDFARGTDLLIHDAQYTDDEYEEHTRGWGHSTWRMAADVAGRARVGCLALYHHDPAHDDSEIEEIERSTRGKFSRCIAAAEGLEVRI